MEAASALLERSGVTLTETSDGPPTFRYGDLIEWMQAHNADFHRWAEDYDPVLRGSRDLHHDGGA